MFSSLESTLLHAIHRKRGLPSVDALYQTIQAHPKELHDCRWLDPNLTSLLPTHQQKKISYPNDCLFERLISLYARTPKHPLWTDIWNVLHRQSNTWEENEWTSFFGSLLGSGMAPVFKHLPGEVVSRFLKKVSDEHLSYACRSIGGMGDSLCQAPYPDVLERILKISAIPPNLFIQAEWLLPHFDFDNIGSTPPISPLLCAVMEPRCARSLLDYGADPFLRVTLTGLTAIASLFHQDPSFFHKDARAPTLNVVFCKAFPKKKLAQDPRNHPDLFFRFFECVAHSRESKDIEIFSNLAPRWLKAVLSNTMHCLQMSVVNPLMLARLFPKLSFSHRKLLLTATFTGALAPRLQTPPISSNDANSVDALSGTSAVGASEQTSLPNPSFGATSEKTTSTSSTVSFSLYDCLLASAGGTLWYGQDAKVWQSFMHMVLKHRKDDPPAPLYTPLGVKRYLEHTLFLRAYLVGGSESKNEHTPSSNGHLALHNPRPLFGFAQTANGADKPDDLYSRVFGLFSYSVPPPQRNSDSTLMGHTEHLGHLFIKHVKTFIAQLSEAQHHEILAGWFYGYEQAPLHSPFSTSLYYEDGLFGSTPCKRIRPSTPEAASFSILVEAVKRVCLLAEDTQSKKPNQASYQNVCDALCTATTRKEHLVWFKNHFNAQRLSLEDLQRVFSTPGLSFALCSQTMFEQLTDRQQLLEHTFYELSPFSEHAKLKELAHAPAAPGKTHRFAL